MSQVQSTSSNPDTLKTSQNLRRASTYIFLIVSIMLVIVTARLAFEEEREYMVCISISCALITDCVLVDECRRSRWGL